MRLRDVKSFWTKSRLFIFLCVSLIFLLVIYSYVLLRVQKPTKNVKSPWQPLSKSAYNVDFTNIVNIYIDTNVSNNTPNQAASNSRIHALYSQMLQDYNDRLANIPRSKYENSTQFITYGETLGEIRTRHKHKSKEKLVLIWTPFFGNWNYFMESAVFCEGGAQCLASRNRSDLLKSDAVIMHPRDMRGTKSLPYSRLPHQIWIYFLRESSYHTGIRPVEFNGVFNWTATYRRDADIFNSYFVFHKRKTPLSETEYKNHFKKLMELKGKTIVAIMHSHCVTPYTNRFSYVKELQKFIPVDTYGACGKLSCPRRSESCNAKMKSYKFYLSMENSHCRDYISEKVRRPLQEWHSVPVVMGADDPGNYAEVLPAHSYIHTSGFKSPKELAEYLLLLDSQPVLYEQYHRWKINYTVDWPNWWCQMCAKLNNDSLPSQSYRDFQGWYNQDTCKSDGSR